MKHKLSGLIRTVSVCRAAENPPEKGSGEHPLSRPAGLPRNSFSPFGNESFRRDRRCGESREKAVWNGWVWSNICRKRVRIILNLFVSVKHANEDQRTWSTSEVGPPSSRTASRPKTVQIPSVLHTVCDPKDHQQPPPFSEETRTSIRTRLILTMTL